MHLIPLTRNALEAYCLAMSTIEAIDLGEGLSCQLEVLWGVCNHQAFKEVIHKCSERMVYIYSSGRLQWVIDKTEQPFNRTQDWQNGNRLWLVARYHSSERKILSPISKLRCQCWSNLLRFFRHASLIQSRAIARNDTLSPAGKYLGAFFLSGAQRRYPVCHIIFQLHHDRSRCTENHGRSRQGLE